MREKNIIFMLLILFFIAGIFLINQWEWELEENKNFLNNCVYVEIAREFKSPLLYCLKNKEELEKIIGCPYKGEFFSGLSLKIKNHCIIKKREMDGIKLLTLSLKINLNSANKDDLKAIKGIGEKMAEKIINERKILNKFKKVEELLKIKGIGEKKLNKIKDFIYIGK